MSQVQPRSNERNIEAMRYRSAEDPQAHILRLEEALRSAWDEIDDARATLDDVLGGPEWQDFDAIEKSPRLNSGIRKLASERDFAREENIISDAREVSAAHKRWYRR